MEQDDVNAWEAFCLGDKSGLEWICNRHKEAIYSYCLYVTGNPQLSEDVVQETFIKLMERKSALQINSSLKGWLFICARNLLYNHLKKLKRERLFLMSSLAAAAEIDIETRLFVENVMGRLSPNERELIILREQQRLTTKEISEILSLSEEAVRVRLFRVRKKMRQIARKGL